MVVGDRIRQLRLHKRMTQSELVGGLTSIAYLSRVENGNTKPSLKFICSIAPKLGVKVEDLIEQQGAADAERRIGRIYCQFQKEKNITDEDLSFLRLNATDLYPTSVHLKVYTILIYYSSKLNIDLEEAYRVYELSKRFISEQVESGLEEEFFYYYRACGAMYFRKQNYMKASYYDGLREELLAHVTDRREIANFYLDMSITKQEILTDQTVSLFYAQKAYDLFLEINDQKQIASVLITMGIQYHMNQKLDKSVEFLTRARETIDPDNSYFLGIIEFHLGRVQATKGNPEIAIEYYLRSLQYFGDLDAANKRICVYRGLVEVYIEIKEWDKVEYYLNKGLSTVDPERFPSLYIDLVSIQAGTYRFRQDEARYEKEMQRIINLGIECQQFIPVMKLAKQMASYYYEKRAYKKAANYFMMAMEYEEELTLERCF
ncbi:helix-turn-helix domain-containing protein [Thermoactinomyces sp. DSM 45892]|uniref:helix-turn-helix domain-containing protein n=1 Tax=Thermoactinomyces sp. DSM 45892 TaxID=1882753 RepID=UPI0008994C93|nr:helix-turn-helix transcriptional regulator [Thermoactinomyces sp. DSM 45892]SDY37292.1 Helix-turn-helix domain-containing protein [Thermoactinomyces sp. DSM 45892]